MCPPVGARVSHACVSGRAREVEKAVAFRVGGGGVGGMCRYRWPARWGGVVGE